MPNWELYWVTEPAGRESKELEWYATNCRVDDKPLDKLRCSVWIHWKSIGIKAFRNELIVKTCYPPYFLNWKSNCVLIVYRIQFGIHLYVSRRKQDIDEGHGESYHNVNTVFPRFRREREQNVTRAQWNPLSSPLVPFRVSMHRLFDYLISPQRTPVQPTARHGVINKPVLIWRGRSMRP